MTAVDNYINGKASVVETLAALLPLGDDLLRAGLSDLIEVLEREEKKVRRTYLFDWLRGNIDNHVIADLALAAFDRGEIDYKDGKITKR